MVSRGFFKFFDWKIALLVVALSCPAYAKPANQSYAAMYKDILAANLKANDQLVNDLETVAQTLKEFADAQGHFPDAGDDLAGLSLELNAVLSSNPYTGEPTIGKEAGSGDLLDEYSRQTNLRAQIIYDPSLSETIVDKLSVEPHSSWKAKAGTVVAVTNGYDLCLVWGAGIDELPMRDPQGKVRMTVLRTGSN